MQETQAFDPKMLEPAPFEEKVDAWLRHLRSLLNFRLLALLRHEAGGMRVLRCLGGYGAVGPGARLTGLPPCSGTAPAIMLAPARGQRGPPVFADNRPLPARAMIAVRLDAGPPPGCGLLCALDPNEQPQAIRLHEAALRFAANRLGIVLSRAIADDETHRARERSALELASDPVSHLLSGPAWTRALDAEEARCRRLGGDVGVVALQLSGAHGDERAIRRSGWILRNACGQQQLPARLGDHRFAVLVLGQAQAFADRLQRSFEAEAIGVRIAAAQRGLGPLELESTAIAALREVV